MLEETVSLFSIPPRPSPFARVWNWQITLLAGIGIILGLIAGAIGGAAVILFDIVREQGVEALMAYADPANMPPIEPSPLAIIVQLAFQSLVMLGVVSAVRLAKNVSWREIGLGSVDIRWLAAGAALAVPFLFIRLMIAAGIVGAIYLLGGEDLAAIAELEQRSQVLSGGAGAGLIPVLLTVMLVSAAIPIVEELYFRGILFRWLRGHMSFWGASSISAIVFGMAHLNPIVLIPAAILGFPLAWVYERSGSLWPAIIMHGVTNFVAQGLIYVALFAS